MANSYNDFSTIKYQGKDYLVVYIDPQNYDAIEIDGTTPEKALTTLPDDLRCPIMPLTRDIIHASLNIVDTGNAAYEKQYNIPVSAFFDANKYGVCYLIKRTNPYTGTYIHDDKSAGSTKRKKEVNYDVPLYPYNDTYSAQPERGIPYSLRNIMFLGCPKEGDDLWYLLPDELKTDENWGASEAEYAHIYPDITPTNYPNPAAGTALDASIIRVDDNGYNEHAIFHIEDPEFESIVINRCYIYRKCKQYNGGTYGMRGIFDIFNNSDRSHTNCVIQNSKFGFCELIETNDSGNIYWQDKHWNLEEEWTEAKTDVFRARRYFMIESYRNCKFDNNIINYIQFHGGGFNASKYWVPANSSYNTTCPTANPFTDSKTNKWYKLYTKYWNRYGIHHGSFVKVAESDGVRLGLAGTSIQLINNKLNILTSPALYNIDRYEVRASNNGFDEYEQATRQCVRYGGYCLNVSADQKTGVDSSKSWPVFYEKTNVELYGLTVKYIFNKSSERDNYIPNALNIDGFNKTIIKDIKCGFQRNNAQKIIDAEITNDDGTDVIKPATLRALYNPLFNIRVAQFNISDLDLRIERCWYLDETQTDVSFTDRNFKWNTSLKTNVLRINKFEEWNRRKDLGRVETIKNIFVYTANGDNSETTVNEGYGPKPIELFGKTGDYKKGSGTNYYLSAFEHPAVNINFKKYGKQIIRENGLHVYNYWGNAAELCGLQFPESSLEVFGELQTTNCVGTAEYVCSPRSGNVITAHSGSVLRIKKVLVDVLNKTDVTPVVTTWPIGLRFFGESSDEYNYSYDASITRYLGNDWKEYNKLDNLNATSYNTNELGFAGFNENGSYVLIDRCNKVILSDINFQSTAYGDNYYGITCLNENDRTFDLSTPDTIRGNGRYTFRSKNYFIQPYSIARLAGSEASLLISNKSGDANITECCIGRLPFKGIQVECKDAEGNLLDPGYYKLELFTGLKNWKLSEEFLQSINTIENIEKTDEKFVDQYILNNFKHMFSWEACLNTKLDETTEYEKINSSDSDGYYEMKTYDDHTDYYLDNSNKTLVEIKEIINNDNTLTESQKQEELDKLEWEWTGDKFINTFDYRFKSTIIVKIEKPEEPINVRLHFNVYNDLGGTFYVDPLIQIKPLN